LELRSTVNYSDDYPTLTALLREREIELRLWLIEQLGFVETKPPATQGGASG
jgi:hypothetical protein